MARSSDFSNKTSSSPLDNKKALKQFDNISIIENETSNTVHHNFIAQDFNTVNNDSNKINSITHNVNSYNSLPLLSESLWSIMESYIHYYASGKNHTARAKRHDLEHFLGFLAMNQKSLNEITVSDWTREASIGFIEDRLESGEAPSTVARRLATIKHFGRTLADRVPGFVNPAREVKAPVYETVKPQGLDSKEIAQLREAARLIEIENQGSFVPLRNRTILETLLGTGLRADEVRALKRGQVADDKSWLKHVKTKGKRFRDIYLHKELSDYIDNYLTQSKSFLIEKFPEMSSWSESKWSPVPVFISIKNANPIKVESFSLAPKTLWRIISELGEAARRLNEFSINDSKEKINSFENKNIEFPHLHPHKLRHTFAHGLLDTSNDIRLVAQALGHSDVRTTMRYTERYKDELAIAMERRANLIKSSENS
ncbi:MAG TPA: tyrosine-type recombinase/integrase [Oligoflexia bacterium]|nr:tyrosine-type recombinase/integrase [Oligoflexia bacterium]HMP48703.1 tyrosine-type recombinase/integrase [Oligoflexia bacterium]